LRGVQVFVRGTRVFADKNPYYPVSARRTPDARLTLDTAAFSLPLEAGDNEIVLAVDNDFPNGHHHYGWGIKLRLDDLDGIRPMPGGR
jgi:hypothetical protein